MKKENIPQKNEKEHTWTPSAAAAILLSLGDAVTAFVWTFRCRVFDASRHGGGWR